jgi:hypothetical protein
MPSKDTACFMRGMKGKFEGGGEGVRVREYPYRDEAWWYADLWSQQVGVGAKWGGLYY